MGENTKVSIRNIRRDSNDDLKKDEKKALLLKMNYVQELTMYKITDESIKEVEKVLDEKEKDIMSV